MDYFGLNMILAAAIFSLGAAGALMKRNAISLFMCVELMLNAANLAIINFAAHLGGDAPIHGALIVLFVITVAAAEAAVGLAIFIKVFHDQDHIELDKMEVLKG